MTKRGRDSFTRFKGIINFVVAIYRVMPLNLRKYLFDKHRNIRGKIGLGLRYAILKATAHSCGDNVAIYPGVYIFNIENLCIGNNVSIQPMCYIECGYNYGGYILKMMYQLHMVSQLWVLLMYTIDKISL